MSAKLLMIKCFPHPTIMRVNGVPTYETIKMVQRMLSVKASSVHSNIGDIMNGLLSLTVTADVYATVSTIAFVVPANLGPQPAIPPVATGSQISELVRQHKELLQIWKEHLNMDKALHQQLLVIFDNMYLKSLRNRMTGFANVTTMQLIQHLYTTYQYITPGDLTDNNKRIQAPYDPSLSIKTLFG